MADAVDEMVYCVEDIAVGAPAAPKTLPPAAETSLIFVDAPMLATTVFGSFIAFTLSVELLLPLFLLLPFIT